MIKTCVIFCGGFGKRLGSITKKKPKPMVLVNKKPFLEHLLIQIKNLGIKKVFLLVGYKKKQIIDYFKSGRKLGLQIEYSYCAPENETGFRLNLIKDRIKEDFLLMYCDNYCPINLKKNFLIFKKKKSLLTLSVCKKNGGNISISLDDQIKYDASRKKKFNFVEIGYIICNKKFLKYINNENISINKYFTKKKIIQKISAIKIYNKYLSISDRYRLAETRKFFKKKNIILIDRDGVLNLKNKNSRYVRNINELKMNDKLISILKRFPQMKYVCITNQAGIATKELKKTDLNKINNFIKKYLKKRNIKLIQFLVSMEHFKSKSFFRKPNPGNFLKAANKYKLLLDKTFYIGDDPRDVLASYNANTKCVYMGDRNKLKSFIKSDMNSIILNNLSKAIHFKRSSIY
jgi:D-glycero-D-manno-heptose 1,7-bisphosphate phosphatase